MFAQTSHAVVPVESVEAVHLLASVRLANNNGHWNPNFSVHALAIQIISVDDALLRHCLWH